VKVHAILWYWNGWRPVYDWQRVNAMVRMLRPNLPESARIICLSDQVQTVWHPPECEVFPLWPSPKVQLLRRDMPNCFRRLGIFSPKHQRALGIEPGDIILSVDLDSVVCGPLLPLLAPMTYWGMDGPVCDFAAFGGLAARIHGSLFAFRAGTHTEVWDKFHPQLSPIEMRTPMPDGWPIPIGSDQAWLSRKVKGEHLWRESDGVYSWNRHGLIHGPGHTANQVYWSFAGPNKPWSPLVKQVRPDLHCMYMDAYEGRR
jgi:hypothetical protein